jgi:putative ABC transport system permease protein
LLRLESLGGDFRFAARLLRKNPGFTAVAVLTLALGIGANTAMWSIADAVLLRPLDYPQSERIAVLGEKKGCCEFAPTSPANFLDYQRRNRSFVQLAALFPRNLILTRGAGGPLWLRGEVVTPNYFAVLGARPLLGRTLSPAVDRPGATPAAVLSYGLWQREFAAARDIVGRYLTLNGRSYAVVGVMPDGFTGLGARELWVSSRLVVPELADSSPPEFVLSRGANYLLPVGRLRPGTTLAQARADLDGILQEIQREVPGSEQRRTAQLKSLQKWQVGNVGPTLWTLVGAVGMILLVACANLANLLLARATVRQREMAVRASVGATPTRLVRQLLAESVLLGTLGGALGLVLALFALRLVSVLEAEWLPHAKEIHADSQVFLFALIAVFLSVLFSGLLPAERGARVDLQDAMRQGDRSGTAAPGQRLRRLVVIAEIAMSLALLIGSGLLLRSFTRLLANSPGFEPTGIVAARIQLPAASYPRPAVILSFFDRLLARVQSLPDIVAVGLVDSVPFGGGNINGDLAIDGRRNPEPGQAITAERRVVSAGYFRALRIPLLRGRLFGDSERSPAKVTLVNENLAHFAWPHEDAIGKRLSWDGGATWMTVVGVVGNVHVAALDERPTLDTYVPYTQSPTLGLFVVVRSGRDPLRLASPLRAEVLAIDPDQPISTIDLLDDLLARSFAGRRFQMLLVGSFALFALLLASLGIYGVMSYTLARRTPEIGIRIALGAGYREVLRLLLSSALATTAAGVAVGIVMALALGRFLEALLYGTVSYDLGVFVVATAVLSVVALLASLVPALRALRIDPSIALRAN